MALGDQNYSEGVAKNSLKNIKESEPIFEYNGKKLVVRFEEFKEDMILLLPAEICKEMELMENDPVDVTVKDGTLVIKKL